MTILLIRILKFSGSNRTFMELKCGSHYAARKQLQGSNRTFMELKYISTFILEIWY